MSQQLAPKSDRPPISLSLTQPHSKQQKNRSNTPLGKSLSDDAPLGETRRASTPTKPKILKVVLLDEHKAREKAAKTHKNSTDNGADVGKSSDTSSAKNGGDTTNGKKATNGALIKPEADEVILIEDESPKKAMRESSRQKNTPTRNEAKVEEPVAKKKVTPDTSSTTSAKSKSPRNVEKEKEVEEVGKLMGTPPATPPKKVEKKGETATPVAKAAASAKVTKKASQDQASESLLQDPSFKGFENDEMESLMVEVVNELDSPMPPKTLGKSPGGKVLRMSAGPPNRARISPFRRVSERNAAIQQNASTIVNLSTVSEQSTEAKSFTSSPAVGMSSESSFGHSMRVISGRRTVRPINEISLTAYRNLNDSASSMNATVGSEINDSFRTPVVSVIGRKRFQNDSPDHPYGSTERIEKEMATDSPKRARFDFNGLMDFVASPVTMLRNRLSRAKLQSTPKSVAKMMEEDDEKLEIPSLDTSEIEKVASDDGETEPKELVEGDEAKEAKKEGDVEMQCDEAATKIVGGDEEIVVTEISASKRRNCSIM